MRTASLPARMLLLTGLVVSLPAAAADPAWYRKQGTWHETMIASREALARKAGAVIKGMPLPNLGDGAFTITAWIQTRRGFTCGFACMAR